MRHYSQIPLAGNYQVGPVLLDKVRLGGILRPMKNEFNGLARFHFSATALLFGGALVCLGAKQWVAMATLLMSGLAFYGLLQLEGASRRQVDGLGRGVVLPARARPCCLPFMLGPFSGAGP